MDAGMCERLDGAEMTVFPIFIPSGGGGPGLSGREILALCLGMVVGMFFGGMTAVWIGHGLFGNQDMLDIDLFGLGEMTGLFLMMAAVVWTMSWSVACAFGFCRLIK
jgi:hypothetical protein